jgi:ABC-type transport system involved in multi-copper enzyme maturation permease subunit/regulation of enolase protein 1 (concanavalin A-like superfamily)
MTTQTVSGPRPEAGLGDNARGGGFWSLLRAEWIKFRSVRGWTIGMVVAALLIIFLGVFAGANASIACHMNGGPTKSGKACLPHVPHGPGGEVVSDSFSFVRQPLAGNGTMTVRVTALTGQHAQLSAGPGQAGAGTMVPGLTGWAKAGILIKQSTRQGSAYAAMMVTGRHGVRMQENFTGDTAGLPGAVSAGHPRWLRLTRSGDTITGYDSADGSHWIRVGTARLTGLPSTVQVGMFAATPAYTVTQNSFGGSSTEGGPARASGAFDHVSLAGGAPGGTWTGGAIGGGGPAGAGPPGAGPGPGGVPALFTRNGGSFTVRGSGDIAPVGPGPDGPFPTVTIEQSLVGAFVGLIAIVVVAAMFFSTEYRRGLIRTTLAAAPRRGRVLAAKAVVIGTVAFVTGLVAAVVSIAVGVPKEESSGQVLLSVPFLTEGRVIIGTAAMLAVAAVFAVALGAILRRSAAAITIAVITVVLPFLLAALNVLPAGVSDWLLRLTPAAGLAIEQSIPRYSQVTTFVSAAGGYYPLSPYAGFAVLCLWAGAALALALVLLRRRDA